MISIAKEQQTEEIIIKIKILQEDMKRYKEDDDRRKMIEQDLRELSSLERKFKSTHDKSNILRELCDIIECGKIMCTINFIMINISTVLLSRVGENGVKWVRVGQ